MRLIGSCKTCKHWKPYLEEFPNTSQQYRKYLEDDTSIITGRPRILGGLCQSSRFTEEYKEEDYEPDRLVYPYTEGGYFWTGPEFGCTHWEEKK